MATIFRSKRTSSPYCQNPLLHFYISLSFFFFFLRHQLAPQSEFCVWHARSVNYKNSSFKASFALFCGKKFPLSRNCSGTRDNCLRCFPNSICPDAQTNFRKCVILLKVDLTNTQKGDINKRAPTMCQAPCLPCIIQFS